MKKSAITIVLILIANLTYAQDELLNLIDEDDNNKKEYVDATFKGTRLILGHSVKMRAKKELEFLVSHRFGRVNRGINEFFGLDIAVMRMGLEYGLLDNLNVGVGRSSSDKTVDGFVKYEIVRQSTGKGSFPLSIVLLNSFTVKTGPSAPEEPGIEFSDRLANVTQLLIASKVNSLLSLQLMPAFVHKNAVSVAGDEKDQVVLGAGGRIKLTPGLTFNAEYYYRIDPVENTGYTNAFSVGFDIETGGHVFQLHFTNSMMTVERAFLTETFDDFFDGDIHFGFNISRTFHLGSKKGGW